VVTPNESDPVEPDDDTIRPTDHSRLRSVQGRPINQVVNDIQRAGPGDVFIQVDDGRFVIRGPHAREHIVEPNGEHVTSIQPRTNSAHLKRLRDGKIRPATPEEFALLRQLAE
jgi:hypothetical protein